MRIVVDSVGASYGAKEVLRDVTFALDQGETVGLVGPNGHGKTTLMKRILDLIPGTGETTFDGKPYRALTRPQLMVGSLLLPRTGAVALLVAGSALVEPLLGQLVARLELWGTSAAAFLPFRAGSSLISFADPALTAIVAETAPRLPAIGGGTLFFLYVAVLLGAGYRKVLFKAL